MTDGADRLRVLFVDDDETARDGVASCLAAEPTLAVETVASIAAATDRVEDGGVDCVVGAGSLPDGDGPALVSAVRGVDPDVAVVLYPADGSEQLAAAAVEAGVDGYRPRGTLADTCDQLAADVVGAVGKRREQTGMVDRMTDAFLTLDTEFRFTYVNERGRAILSEAIGEELTAGELRGKSLLKDLPGTGEEGFYDRYQEVMDTRESITFEEYYEQLSSWFKVRVYPVDVGIAVYMRDVTDRREYAHKLEHREAVLTELYRIIADTERSFDEKVDELFSIGRSELDTEYATLSRIEDEEYVFESVQTPPDDDGVTAGDVVDLSTTSCERAIVTDETLVIEDMAEQAPEIAQRAGNVKLGLSCYLGTPVTVDDDVSGTFCFYGTEPTEQNFSRWQITLVELMGSWVSYERQRQRREQQLTRERNRMEEFADVVSHDLRSPLSLARARLELAGDECDSPHLDDVEGALDRMERLIDDVLTLARMGEQVVDTEQTDFDVLVQLAWKTAGSPEGELVVDDTRTVVGDEVRLQRLFENLFRNAVDHGSEDVTVTVGQLEEETGFYVADDGPGIPEDERADVFDHGHTTDRDGTGFGLSIVSRIVEAHGGEVTVTGSDAGGARFEIRGIEVR